MSEEKPINIKGRIVDSNDISKSIKEKVRVEILDTDGKKILKSDNTDEDGVFSIDLKYKDFTVFPLACVGRIEVLHA